MSTRGALAAIGWRDPGNNEAQRAFLHSMRPRNLFVAGRGAGKTMVLCQRARIFARTSPGMVCYLTEQTTADIEDILIPAWELVVPQSEYRYRTTKGGRLNAVMRNGSVIRFRARHSKNLRDDPPFRGPYCGYIGHDEAALDIRSDVPNISEMMLRDPVAHYLISDYATTPKPNWFWAFAKKHGVAEPGKRIQVSTDQQTAAFYGRTADNRFNRGLDQRMRGNLSQREADQELEGWFVGLDGLCWDTFSEDLWPHGNMWPGGFVQGHPYILSVDHGGANGAWGIFQALPGRPHVPGNVLVLMAEFTPGGPPRRVLPQIIERFGMPMRIFTGADHNTPGPTGDTAAQMFAERGWGDVELLCITNGIATKMQQANVLAGLILNTMGERRFAVSKQLQSFYAGPTRGVMDMLRSDSWPDTGDSVFRKEKDKKIYHEDSRDMLLYCVTGLFPPQWETQRKFAA